MSQPTVWQFEQATEANSAWPSLRHQPQSYVTPVAPAAAAAAAAVLG